MPASLVEANSEFSTGRLHASIDQGALSYILRMQKKKHTQTSNKWTENFYEATNSMQKKEIN